MKLVKLDLLILLISLFIFSGCENPDGIGLNDTDYQNGIQVDTFTVQSQLVADLPVRTDNRFSNNGNVAANNTKLLGYMNDAIFGKSYAELNTQFVKPDSAAFAFPAEAVLDSAVLVLAYQDTSKLANTFYGSATSKFRFIVEELGDPMRVDTSYYSNQYFNPKNATPIGTALITPNLNKIKVMDFINDKPDTLKTAEAQIRVPIDKNYAIQKFVNAPSSIYESTANFNSYFKGIKLRIDPNGTTGLGGIFKLNVQTTDKSVINFYYHNATDTTFHTLRLSGGVAQSNYFKHDYAGTIIETLLGGGTNTQQTVYVQSMAGVKTKVKFPYIKLINKDSKRAINKAELIVTVDPGSDGTFTGPARILLNQGQNKSGSFIQIADNNISDTRYRPAGAEYSGYYNSSKKNYSILVTKYVQDILDGKANDDNLFLTFDNPAISGERAVFGGPKGLSYSMKLRIIYSDVKQTN
ncbi:DUF4270 domain-containing protein [Solitalea sp. MAHUQ-68]|uniref:DUF4270 domain-containing protein n=1 Tax=Solitalea agri TaxID=2953739 RepID=A0A9X2F2H5_9SPHI|nr:DUF4270 family protein [Solitalea agri]MCO4293397.1 DUF4270 domain-containing protein [Solitalea agri]